MIEPTMTAEEIADRAEELKEKHEKLIDLMVEAAAGMRQHDEALLKIAALTYEVLGANESDPNVEAIVDKIIDSIEYS